MNRHMARAFGATALGTLLLQPVTTLADPPAVERGGYHSRDVDPRDDRRDDRHDERDDYDHRRRDSDDDYPRRGCVVQRLPYGARVLQHHGHRYYYSRGAWYRPYGPRYVVTDLPHRRW